MLIFWPICHGGRKSACLGAGTVQAAARRQRSGRCGRWRCASGERRCNLASQFPGDILELRTGLVADGASERLLGDCHHPFWEDDSGTVWKAVLDQDGWQVVSRWSMPLSRARQHQSEDGRRCFDFQLRLHAYAGKPWFQAEYRLLHAEEEAELLVRRIAWRWQAARPLSSAGQRAVARSNYRTQTRALSGNDGVLEQEIDADWLLFESNEQMQTRGTFWGDWRDRVNSAFTDCLQLWELSSSRVSADFLKRTCIPPAQLVGMASGHCEDSTPALSRRRLAVGERQYPQLQYR